MQQTHNPELLRLQPREELLIFDELSTVRMYQDDIARFGFVRPETRQQVYNEELTFVAESLDAPHKTDFLLTKTNSGLVDERGTPLGESLDRGILAAENAARQDARKTFNLRRAVLEREEGRAVESMMDDDQVNTIVVCSPFAHEAHAQFGNELVESLGMNPERQLGFMRIYQKVDSTTLRMISLTVDNSDLDCFRGVMRTLGTYVPPETSSDDFIGYRYEGELDELNQEILPDRLRHAYDQNLKQKYNREFKAGRADTQSVDAWRFIEAQRDLVGHYFDQLEKLAHTNPSRREKVKLTISFWSALKGRMDQKGADLYTAREINDGAIHFQLLQQEMARGLNAAVAKHERMLACGGGFGLAEDLLDNNSTNLFNTIFGTEAADAKESWDWKPGRCIIENCPTSPRMTKVGPCSICKLCQFQFDQGKNPTQRYKNMSN